jgi:hypothetical protein
MAKGKTKQLVELERDIARRMRKERLKEEKRAKEQEESLEKEMDVSRVFRERGYRFGQDDIYDVKPRLQELGVKIEVTKNESQGAKPGEMDVFMPVLIV